MSKWFIAEEDLKPKEFNGNWADFHKKDGDYFIESGGSSWIVRCVGGEDIYRIFSEGNHSYFFHGSNNWGETKNYKITPATTDQSEHLNSCIKHGCYMEPPRSLENSRELEDGTYVITRNNKFTWLAKFQNNQTIGQLRSYGSGKEVFSSVNAHWGNGILVQEATPDQIKWLDKCISAGKLVPETDSVSTDIVFKGQYRDFKPEDGDYVLQQPIGIPYLSRYKNGKIVGELADRSNKFITADTWEPHYNIEARKATSIETKQLDASILKGEYVSLEEALARDLGKPDAIIVDIENNPLPVDFKSHNAVFDLQNLSAHLGTGLAASTGYDITVEPNEIQRLKEIINRQEKKINKLSQTWMQKLKNMIGPLV